MNESRLPTLVWLAANDTTYTSLTIQVRPAIYDPNPGMNITLNDGKRRTASGATLSVVANDGPGAGKLDVSPGTQNKWYYFYLIPDPNNDNGLAAIASLRGPTHATPFPLNQPVCRYIGAAKMAAAAYQWNPFVQRGEWFQIVNAADMGIFQTGILNTQVTNNWYNCGNFETSDWVPTGVAQSLLIAGFVDSPASGAAYTSYYKTAVSSSATGTAAEDDFFTECQRTTQAGRAVAIRELPVLGSYLWQAVTCSSFSTGPYVKAWIEGWRDKYLIP